MVLKYTEMVFKFDFCRIKRRTHDVSESLQNCKNFDLSNFEGIQLYVNCC